MNVIKNIVLLVVLALPATMVMAQSPPTSDSPDNKATKRIEFELGIEMLRGYRADLQDRLEKSIGLLIIVIGWLITSETARKSLGSNSFLWWGSVAVLTALLIIYCATVFRFICNFWEIEKTIHGLDYIDARYKLTRYQMPVLAPLFYMAPIASMYTVIALILIQIKRHSGNLIGN
ncbi:MAG: hypothetical protein ACKVQW_07145 [Pyrinomonadaceae bacterium]